MTTLTIAAAELRRIALAVEKSAAKDESRPVLAGIHAEVKGDRLTLAAADGFRLSTAYATLDESPGTHVAILERAGLVAFAKSLKPKHAPVATIDTAAETWTFSANGTRATVRLIDGTYPDFSSIVASGDEPVLFTVNPHYFANVLASHGDTPIHVARADDSASSPLFFTAGDGTRHVVMPMILGADTERQRCKEAAAEVATPVAEVAAEVEPEPAPAPVTVEESAFRTQRAANERRLVKRAERRAAAAAGTITHDAPVCATCNAQAAPADNFCGECGSPFGEPAPVSITRPSVTPYALASYSTRNQERILDACPAASEVRTFHGWLAAGRVVMKGQKGIRIVAPDEINGGKVTRIRHMHVFDVSQTQERTPRAIAA